MNTLTRDPIWLTWMGWSAIMQTDVAETERRMTEIRAFVGELEQAIGKQRTELERKDADDVLVDDLTEPEELKIDTSRRAATTRCRCSPSTRRLRPAEKRGEATGEPPPDHPGLASHIEMDEEVMITSPPERPIEKPWDDRQIRR